MRLGKLFFAGAIFLALAYFALRSPIPAADPRFLQAEVADAGAPAVIAVYLDTGYLRERAQQELAGVAADWREAARGTDAAAPSARHAQALEAAAVRLQRAGIGNVMLRFGHNLVVRGRRGNGPWRVGLRNPRGTRPDDALAYLLADRDEAVASHGGERVVTVIGADGVAATAAAQALHAAGQQWPELARQRGLDQVMVVEADGAIHVTKALNDRLKFLRGATPLAVH
jgi:hypothetical protein